MLIAKVGDVAPGICVCVAYPMSPYPATGVVMSGNTDITTGGSPVAMAGTSLVSFPCGTSVIVPGGVSFTSGGVPLSKLGDTVSGCGNGVLTGTSNITSL